MKKYLKPIFTFIAIWLILTAAQLLIRVPGTKSITWDQNGKILNEVIRPAPGLFDNLQHKMIMALYPTINLIAAYLFIILVIDLIKSNNKIQT